MIPAGKRRHQIVIEQPADAADTRHGYAPTWSTFATPLASYREMSASEAFETQRTEGKRVVEFGIRYIAGITAKMRISYDGALYDIRPPVDPNGRKRDLIITAIERHA